MYGIILIECHWSLKSVSLCINDKSTERKNPIELDKK